MSFFCLLNKIIVETSHGSSALAKYNRTDSIFLNDGKIRRVFQKVTEALRNAYIKVL